MSNVDIILSTTTEFKFTSLQMTWETPENRGFTCQTIGGKPAETEMKERLMKRSGKEGLEWDRLSVQIMDSLTEGSSWTQ